MKGKIIRVREPVTSNTDIYDALVTCMRIHVGMEAFRRLYKEMGIYGKAGETTKKQQKITKLKPP